MTEQFSEFYRSEWSGAVRYAFLLLGEQEAAEDVVQQCFVGMYANWDSVLQPNNYLRTAITNRCRNVWHWRALRALPFKLSVGHISEVSDHVSDVVAKLPFRQRAVIILRYYEGMSNREIAAVLSVPEGTVSSDHSRAIAKLRRDLRE